MATATDTLIASVLPAIDGSGLTQDELFRLNRAANTARAEYARDMPEADSIEVHRVGAAAAADALRAVLRARPAAPCCDSIEEAPCLRCSNLHTIPGVEPEATNPAGEAEADPARFPTFAGWPEYVSNFYWSPRPIPEADTLVSLPELIELEATQLRARGNDAGVLMARVLEDLARVVRTVGALVPGDVAARLEVLERDFAGSAEWEPELTAAGSWA